jgi:hypothetical protein
MTCCQHTVQSVHCCTPKSLTVHWGCDNCPGLLLSVACVGALDIHLSVLLAHLPVSSPSPTGGHRLREPSTCCHECLLPIWAAATDGLDTPRASPFTQHPPDAVVRSVAGQASGAAQLLPTCGSLYAGGVTFQFSELRSICMQQQSSSSMSYALVMLSMSTL